MANQGFVAVTLSSMALALSACGGGGGGGGSTVDDPLPQISIDERALSVTEGDDGLREAVLTVSLDRAAPQSYQIDYSVAADANAANPAAAGADFVADSGSIEVAAGATSASLTLQIVGDRAVEGDETLQVSVSHAQLGSASKSVTIVDDDLAQLSVRDASQTEGDSGQPQMLFTVEIAPAIEGGEVSVDYATVDGSAVADSDYIATNGQLTFAPGVSQQQIAVALMGDALVEPDESFTLRLSSPSANAELSRADAIGTILNDDSAAANRAPVLASIGAQQVRALENLTIALSASDADGNSLSFSASGLPGFARLTDNGDGTASVSAAPQAGDAGDHSITVTVSDGSLSASETFVLTVQPPANRAPELSAIGALSLKGRETQNVAISASDIDADSLSFSADNLPSFVSLTDKGDGSASLSLVPAAEDQGQYSFTLRVSDGELEDSELVSLTVLEADNVAPELAAIADREVKARESLQIALSASDIDGDSLSFSTQNLPAFASLADNGDGTATINANPQDPDQGEHVISVIVSDGETSSQAQFTLTVLEPDNVAPALAAIGNQRVLVDGSLQLDLSASDIDGDSLSFSASGLPAFADLTDKGDGTATLLLEPALADVGSYTLTIGVSDGELADSETFEIVATEPVVDVVINELMADNTTVLLDADGEAVDWIELHNRGDLAVDLQGWCLSDDPEVPQLWCFPAKPLNVGEYLLVFASGKESSADPDELHASFRLTSGGEYLALFDQDGSLMSAHDPNFPKQAEDISWGISSGEQLHYFESPTPGSANGSGIADILDFDPSNTSLLIETGVSRSFPVSLERLTGDAAGYSLSSDQSWLSAATAAGEDGQTTDAIDLTVDAGALSEGEYVGVITAQSAAAADALLTLSLQVVASNAAADVEISEFLASNLANHADGNGEFSDWIELHNRGNSTVDLQGWCLTDDEADLTNWCFTSSTPLAADGYLLVYASKTKPAPAGQHHASFKLGAAGEYLGLIRPNGTVADEYAPTFPQQTTDISYGRDAQDTIGFFPLPTPGAANGVAVESLPDATASGGL